MLGFLRGSSKGLLAKILIALLVISFGVWGISGSILFGGQYNVVQVGETQIHASEYRFAYENQLRAFSQSIGRGLSRQEADSLGLRENVLSQVVAGAVLDENARKMGLGISDENLGMSIASDDNFKDLTGQFSRSTLRNTLAQAGLSEEDYIQSRKRVSMRNQILDGTAASMSMPAAYTDALSIFQKEKRVFDFVTVGSEVAGDIPSPTDSELSSYYDENKNDFVAPEYRKVAILKLEPTDLAKPDDVTDEELRAAYENRKSSLKTPERRQIQQLVLGNADAAEAALKRLSEGATFDEVVSENGKTIADIDLGVLRKDELPDEKVAEAAFAAKLNEPTDVVEGLFGPVIVRVAKIEEESVTSFEDVKDELKQQIATERAVEDVFENFDAIEDERGAGEQILPTGEKLDLETRVIEGVDASGSDMQGNPLTDVPQLRALVQAAFTAEPGDDTQAIEIGENGFLWYDVLEIIPERQKELNEVKSEVREAWIAAKTKEEIVKVAEKIAERVRSGEDFNTVLGETLPTDSLGQAVSYTTTEALQRSGQTPDFPITAVRRGFGVASSTIDTVDIGENNLIVFRVAEIEDAEIEELPADISEQIDVAASQDILSQVVEHLQSRESVVVNRAAIDLAFNPGGGNQHGY